MAFITLAGTLRDPTSELAVGDQIRFTHKSTTGETVEGAVSVLTIDPSGTYSKDLQYGLVLVEYKDVRASQFKNIGVATVNGSNPATSIPELLNALVPVSSAELVEFQAILADAVTARNEAEAFAASIDLINDLSQAYIFDTVAEYKASTLAFPVGKVIHLKDREADFTVIDGVLTANNANIIESTGVNQSISRAVGGKVVFTEFGGIGDNGATDNTVIFDALESYLSDGDELIFSNGKFKGTFRTKKAVNVTFESASLTNATALDGILQVGPSGADFTSYAVTEAALEHLDTTFTVTGASDLFMVGDIGYLWDKSERPTDSQGINFEVIKIKGVAADVVTIEGFIHSNFSTSDITFYHSTLQPKNIVIKGFNATPDNTHLEFAVRVSGADNVTFRDSVTENTVGNAVSARHCWNVKVFNTTTKKPRLVTSGQGYGVALFAVTHATVHDLFGEGTRHILDADSVYEFDYKNIHEPDDQTAAVGFAHNGFGSYGTIQDVYVGTKQHAVSASEQGFGIGALNADKAKHPIRSVKINNVHSTMDASVAPDDNVATVYLQNNVDNVHIHGVHRRHINQAALTTGAQSSLVRVNGVPVGPYSVKNLTSDKIGRFHYSNGDRDGATAGLDLAVFEDFTAKEVDEPILLFGSWALSVSKLNMGVILGDVIIKMATISSDDPYGLYVGNHINYGGASKQIYETSVLVDGEVARSGKNTNISTAVVAGYVITAVELQNSSTMLRLAAPIAGGSIDMGGFPEPYVDGQRISIFGWLASRQDVILPATIPSIFADVTFNSVTPSHDLVAVAGLWRQAS